MNLSIEAISHIIGAERVVPITEKDMLSELEVVFFPSETKEKELMAFEEKLKKTVKSLGIKITTFDILVDFSEKNNKQKIKDGIVIFFSGSDKFGKMPMDYVKSLSNNPIVRIIGVQNIPDEKIASIKHMEFGLSLFTKHMCNIAICFDKTGWKSYTYNGFSKKHSWNDNFRESVLKSIIPKISTRVFPMKLNEFQIDRVYSDFANDRKIGKYVRDLIKCGYLLSHSKLFPSVMNVDEFQYDNKFYRRIAKSFLDERTGMSYGFIARQLPLKLPEPIEYSKLRNKFNFENKDYLQTKGYMNILLTYGKKKYVLKVPPVWVLMSRSGSNKTRLNSEKDILLIGLENGKFRMKIPEKFNIDNTYKPSFDTRLILSHCLANAIYGAMLKKFTNNESIFSNVLEKNGMALLHWHGFINQAFVPRGWILHGQNNPPVLCSSPQSSIYAFKGKEKAVEDTLLNDNEFLGDIHFEPQHGINITGPTLKRISYFLFSLNSIDIQDDF